MHFRATKKNKYMVFNICLLVLFAFVVTAFHHFEYETGYYWDKVSALSQLPPPPGSLSAGHRVVEQKRPRKPERSRSERLEKGVTGTGGARGA